MLTDQDLLGAGSNGRQLPDLALLWQVLRELDAEEGQEVTAPAAAPSGRMSFGAASAQPSPEVCSCRCPPPPPGTCPNEDREEINSRLSS